MFTVYFLTPAEVFKLTTAVEGRFCSTREFVLILELPLALLHDVANKLATFVVNYDTCGHKSSAIDYFMSPDLFIQMLSTTDRSYTTYYFPFKCALNRLKVQYDSFEKAIQDRSKVEEVRKVVQGAVRWYGDSSRLPIEQIKNTLCQDVTLCEWYRNIFINRTLTCYVRNSNHVSTSSSKEVKSSTGSRLGFDDLFIRDYQIFVLVVCSVSCVLLLIKAVVATCIIVHRIRSGAGYQNLNAEAT